MNCITAVLISIFCSRSSANYLQISSIPNLMPWAESIPVSDFKNFIEVRLVKKNWLPDGANIPTDRGVLERYPGNASDALNIFLNTSTYQHHSKPLVNATELLTPEFGYDHTLESIVIIHTLSGNADRPFVRNIVNALALRNIVRHYNIFTLHMPGLVPTFERTGFTSTFGSRGYYYGLGATIGSFFNDAIRKNRTATDKLHLIGFCFSGQLVGYVARHIKKHNSDRKIRSIVGLDPFSFGLSSVAVNHVSSKDAQIVHLYHTNSLVFGTLHRRATADFVFNNGYFQPGCYTSKNIQCSHHRSTLLFDYVILFNHLFEARSCSSYHTFSSCWCQRNPTVRLSYPPNESARGQFFLRTSAHHPYGSGVGGASCWFGIHGRS